MENAVEGLKLAFAVLLLTMALSLTIAFFSKARTTAEAVLQSSDKTAYYDYSKYSVPQDTQEIELLDMKQLFQHYINMIKKDIKLHLKRVHIMKQLENLP